MYDSAKEFCFNQLKNNVFFGGQVLELELPCGIDILASPGARWNCVELGMWRLGCPTHFADDAATVGTVAGHVSQIQESTDPRDCSGASGCGNLGSWG